MPTDRKPRVLVFIVAYYAESTILEVLERIPDMPDYEVEVLLIDDSSKDGTFDRAERLRRHGYRFPLTVLANPVNQGYGGNQKLGYQYAVQNDFDHVALLHGDAQYAPEVLPVLFEPLTHRAWLLRLILLGKRRNGVGRWRRRGAENAFEHELATQHRGGPMRM